MAFPWFKLKCRQYYVKWINSNSNFLQRIMSWTGKTVIRHHKSLEPQLSYLITLYVGQILFSYGSPSLGHAAKHSSKRSVKARGKIKKVSMFQYLFQIWFRISWCALFTFSCGEISCTAVFVETLLNCSTHMNLHWIKTGIRLLTTLQKAANLCVDRALFFTPKLLIRWQ